MTFESGDTLTVEWELDMQDHSAPYDAARDMAEDLDGEWHVVEDLGSQTLYVVSEDN